MVYEWTLPQLCADEIKRIISLFKAEFKTQMWGINLKTIPKYWPDHNTESDDDEVICTIKKSVVVL